MENNVTIIALPKNMSHPYPKTNILCRPNLLWLCSLLQVFAWCGVHVSPPRNSRRNCPPPVWIVLVAIRVSRYLVLICFCCSCVCWVILQGVCWPVFCNVVIHTCRGWQRYIPPLLRHFFLWVFILWLFHLVCIWGWCVWIHGVWVVLWYRSLIYLLSWIWPLWWRLRYWRGFWPPAYRLSV